LKASKKQSPSAAVVDDDGDDVCVICQKQFIVGDYVRTLCCQDTFHCECVDQWFNDSKVVIEGKEQDRDDKHAIERCPACQRLVVSKAKGRTPPPQVNLEDQLRAQFGGAEEDEYDDFGDADY
jgi:hypothetical protein